MSDPYTEATRNERKGMSTLARVFLVGGGLVVAALAALFIWFFVSMPMMFGGMPSQPPPPPPVELSKSEAVDRAAELDSLRLWQAAFEVSLKREAEQAQVEASLQEARQELVAARARMDRLAQQAEALAESRREQVRAAEEAAVAANLQQRESSGAPEQESVAEELSRAVNTFLESAFEDEGFSVEPVGAGVGLSFDIRSGKVSTRFDLVSDPEKLDRVSRGEGRFADLWPDDATERAEARGKPLPEWVPVFPGVDRKKSLSVEVGDFALGTAVFVAEASGPDILLWYFRAADRMERAGTDFSFRQLRADGQPGATGELGRFAMGWEDRQVSVFVTEDGHGDSLFVLVYKG